MNLLGTNSYVSFSNGGFNKSTYDYIKQTKLTKIGAQSYILGPKSILACAAKYFELSNYYLRASFDMFILTFVT